MAFLEKLMDTVTYMVTKPISLVSRCCMFGLRGICAIVDSLSEITSAAICIHVCIFWRLLVGIAVVISLPARALAALWREKVLEEHLHDLQNRLDTLVWDRKELQERLQLMINERAMMEAMLTELEDEHDQAIHKIVLLETELLSLKDENNWLKDVHSKSLWSLSCQNDQVCDQKVGDAVKGFLSWKSPNHGSGIAKQAFLMQQDALNHEITCKSGADNLLESQNSIPSLQCMTPRKLHERREVALSQSLFSAVLSLLVGMIVWEAEDPCMPLVLALSAVVAMSLMSAVQFFSTIKNKPASDAVALLSFNWFLLGTLTYPTLPRVARMLAPFVISFSEQTIGWFKTLLF